MYILISVNKIGIDGIKDFCLHLKNIPNITAINLDSIINNIR